MDNRSLSDAELETQIDTYANLIVAGISVEENEAILDELILEQSRRAASESIQAVNVQEPQSQFDTGPVRATDSGFVEAPQEQKKQPLTIVNSPDVVTDSGFIQAPEQHVVDTVDTNEIKISSSPLRKKKKPPLRARKPTTRPSMSESSVLENEQGKGKTLTILLIAIPAVIILFSVIGIIVLLTFYDSKAVDDSQPPAIGDNNFKVEAVDPMASFVSENITKGSPFDPTKNYTVVVQFKTTHSSDLYPDAAEGTVLFSWCDATGAWGRHRVASRALYIKDRKLVFDVCKLGHFAGKTDVNDGKWHTVVVRQKNGKLEVYLDGKLEINTPVNLSFPNFGFNFMVNKNTNTKIKRFKGSISRLKYFDRYIELSEIDSAAHLDWPNAKKTSTEQRNTVSKNQFNLDKNYIICFRISTGKPGGGVNEKEKRNAIFRHTDLNNKPVSDSSILYIDNQGHLAFRVIGRGEIKSRSKVNNGKQHTVVLMREGKNVMMMINNDPVVQREIPQSSTKLKMHFRDTDTSFGGWVSFLAYWDNLNKLEAVTGSMKTNNLKVKIKTLKPTVFLD